MANETTVQTSYIQEDHEADECRENIPPGVGAAAETSKLKVQEGEVEGYSSTRPSGENQPLSDTYTFSTPAPASSKGGLKAKSRLSGLQSALTPILKYLNIGNKCPSPETLKQGDANTQKTNDRRSNSDFSSSLPVRLLMDETLPEITLLDVTCDSTMQVTGNDSALPPSVPATPVTAQSVCASFTAQQPSKLNASSTRLNTTTQMPTLKMEDPPESAFAPLRWLDDRYFPEITLLEVTRDSESSPGVERSSMNVTQDISPADASKNNMASSEHGGPTAADPGTMDVMQSEELSSTLEGTVTHTVSSLSEKCEGQNTTKPSLELTRDISMSNVSENSRPSLELSGQNMETNQTLAEAPKTEELRTSLDARSSSTSSVNDTFTVAQNANLSSSSSLSSAAQTPQNMTLDLPSSNVNSPEAESDAKQPAASVSSCAPENSLVVNCSAGKASGSCDVQNATFDRNSLQKSSGDSTLGEAAAAAGTFCVQNNTFDTKAPPQQNGTITLSETSSSDVHQNTMDKPSSPEVCNATSSPKNTTKEVQPPEPTKHNGSTASTESSANMADTPESTFDVDPPVEIASGAPQSETKDPSQSAPPISDSVSHTSVHRRRDTWSDKAHTFNLDDTLDLAADALITSTPMSTCKMFNFNNEREAGKIFGATKKLYGDGPSKPEGQVTSDIPSNIVCDRKTWLTKPAGKSILPPGKTASHLLKYKPASGLPGRFDPSTSGLPMTRQRSQAEGLRSTAASDAPTVTAGTLSSYNLRATTTGSKQPNVGLRKPQSSGIPSGIQRAAAGLRPPSAKGSTPAPATSGTDKLRAPPAGNPVTKISQSKKHPLTRGEALQVAAKRRKMDAPLPSSNAEASASSCDAANKAKNLKQPTTAQKALPAKTQREDAAATACTAETSTSCDAVSRARVLRQPAANHRALLAKPHAHGCANCIVLEQQLKMKSEELKRLKEELLKNCKEEEKR